ncbi:MAG: hypothetical protein EGR71_06600 [Clostridiales bacterium]|nr:hypothetical protein [Clostridiales bacterium]
MAVAVGDKGGSIGLLRGDTLGVVGAILQVCDDVAVVGVIVQVELDVLDVALTVRELLEDVYAIGIDVAAVLQRVKIGSVGALPSQGHSVGVILGVTSDGDSLEDTLRRY